VRVSVDANADLRLLARDVLRRLTTRTIPSP
jgi:hypothetical protein